MQRSVFLSLGVHGAKWAAPAFVGKKTPSSLRLSLPVPLIHIGTFDPPGGR